MGLAFDANDESGAIVVNKYYYLNGLRVAKSRDGVLSWIHSDHLHSATIITDAAGAEIRRLAYRAFGEEAENIGSGETPKYSYTGKERDSSGLMYYGARYYDPALSRFISPDTLYDRGPQGLNRYSYALNNPIRYNDPSGHFINGPDDEQNPTGDGCVTGSPENGGEEMVYHENDDDPSSFHDKSPHQNSAGSHRVGPVTGGGDVQMPFHGGPGALSKIPAEKIVDATAAVGDVAASMAFEIYDWGSTFYRWGQGDFSYWDLAGLAPVIPATAGKYIKKAGETTAIAKFPEAIDFAKKKLFNTHYRKHVLGDPKVGGMLQEWGYVMSEKAYLKRVQRFLSGSPGKNTLQYTRFDGDLVRFNTRTGEFGIASPKGTIRTLFRPQPNAKKGYTSGLEYFLKDRLEKVGY